MKQGTIKTALAALALAASGAHTACTIEEKAPTTMKSPADVGAAGGTVEGDGARIIIPGGALDAKVRIVVGKSTSAPPAGFTAYSPLFTFEPPGTVFARPATIELTASGEVEDARIIWSRPSGEGFEVLPSNATGATVTARVTHFSQGFVGNGVSFTCGELLTACPDACVNLLTDHDNCGACANSCGIQGVCINSECFSTEGCDPGLVNCPFPAPGCTDLQTDINNCGTCNNDCSGGSTCANGVCSLNSSGCDAGLTECPYPSPGCTNLQTDVSNCGACSNLCTGGAACVQGFCVTDG